MASILPGKVHKFSSIKCPRSLECSELKQSSRESIDFESSNPADDLMMSSVFDCLHEGTLISRIHNEIVDDLAFRSTRLSQRDSADQDMDEAGVENLPVSRGQSGEATHMLNSCGLSPEELTSTDKCINVTQCSMNTLKSTVVTVSSPMGSSSDSVSNACVDYEEISCTRLPRESTGENSHDCSRDMAYLKCQTDSVLHDHCYTSAGFIPQTESPASDSMEEGSNSDTGKVIVTSVSVSWLGVVDYMQYSLIQDVALTS